MKQLNRLRAILIYNEYKSGNCSIVLTDILTRFLKDSPSMIERGDCKRKGCCSKITHFHLAALEMKDDVFDGKMENLVKAATEFFSIDNPCHKCRHPYDSFERLLGNHLFIEVELLTTKQYLNNH